MAPTYLAGTSPPRTMNEADENIQYLLDRLALDGSVFSVEEIQDVLNVLRDYSLKLIVANVPRAVFTQQPAQQAFEDLFRSYDPQCTFLYLPSFSRAQIYVTNPEAALCARLQVQGWKLPESVLSQLRSDSTTPADQSGISCYIDHIDRGAEDEADSEEECTCHLQSEFTSSEPIDNHASYGSPPKESADDRIGFPSGTSQTISSANSIGDRFDLSTERRIGTPDCESTSEASGDDTPTATLLSSPKFSCRKHATRGFFPNSKLLAPPLPSRLFLLSPPSSPPVGWEPKPEAEPVINYELLEALAALAPGEAFELHPSDKEHSRPSIVITPCESTPLRPRPQIVHTRCPERKS